MRRRRDLSIAGLLARIRSLWGGWRQREQVEADMAEEFRLHIELRAEDLTRQGVPSAEAARRARLEFGHLESHRERARAVRGLHVLDHLGFSWIDLKLGLRMLVKHPGLSLVAVIGMSVAIALGAGGFGLVHAVVDVELPLEEGDRIVALENSDIRTPGRVARRAVHDFLFWREELGSITDLAAFRPEQAAAHVPGEAPSLARVASMTASGFDVARVAPLLGRTLLPDDELPGAPRVAVIAHIEWRQRFAGDPGVLGRTVRIGAEEHTVVGVMPEGFRFPVNERYWVPLPLDAMQWEVGRGPEITIFGRLAGDATIARAQQELSTLGTRMAAAYPATHEHLRARVLPYVDAYLGVDGPERMLMIRAIEIVLSLLLLVVAVNVSVLVYARTVARIGEIAVRTALGATRRRILTQLFAESLVLSASAAALGLGAVAFGFAWLRDLVQRGGGYGLPFWIELGVSPVLAAYTAGLAVMAAVIIGVLPGLRATGRAIQGRLQELHGGGGRLKLGRTWTGLIVGQVAIAVAVLPYTFYVAGPAVTRGLAEADYPADEFLRVSLAAGDDAEALAGERDGDEVAARLAEASSELVRRLEADPAVTGVTFASRFPGNEEVVSVEVEGSGKRTSVWMNDVDPGLFPVFDIPVLMGRGFTASDADAKGRSVVVDRVFVDEVLGGDQALGRRVRLPSTATVDGTPDAQAGPWLEIVGVVPAFTVPPAFQPRAPKLYRPLRLDEAPQPVHVAIRLRADTPPVSYMVRLREMADAVGADLELTNLQTATTAEAERREGLLMMAILVMAVTGSGLLLSAAGIYALMSFTVASRRREIGIRAALGAGPARLLRGIFRRAAIQLGAGMLVGLLVAEGIIRASGGTFLRGEGAHLLPLVAALMLTIGLGAAVGPARRGLAVQPTEALREE